MNISGAGKPFAVIANSSILSVVLCRNYAKYVRPTFLRERQRGRERNVSLSLSVSVEVHGRGDEFSETVSVTGEL